MKYKERIVVLAHRTMHVVHILISLSALNIGLSKLLSCLFIRMKLTDMFINTDSLFTQVESELTVPASQNLYERLLTDICLTAVS